MLWVPRLAGSGPSTPSTRALSHIAALEALMGIEAHLPPSPKAGRNGLPLHATKPASSRNCSHFSTHPLSDKDSTGTTIGNNLAFNSMFMPVFTLDDPASKNPKCSSDTSDSSNLTSPTWSASLYLALPKTQNRKKPAATRSCKGLVSESTSSSRRNTWLTLSGGFCTNFLFFTNHVCVKPLVLPLDICAMSPFNPKQWWANTMDMTKLRGKVGANPLSLFRKSYTLASTIGQGLFPWSLQNFAYLKSEFALLCNVLDAFCASASLTLSAKPPLANSNSPCEKNCTAISHAAGSIAIKDVHFLTPALLSSESLSVHSFSSHLAMSLTPDFLKADSRKGTCSSLCNGSTSSRLSCKQRTGKGIFEDSKNLS